MFLKTIGRKKTNTKKNALLVRSKLNSIEKILSKTLIDSDISHEEVTIGINEKQNHVRIKRQSAG